MSSIRRWLSELGLTQYADRFEAHDIDTALLPRLTDQVLKDIGVASAGHRLRILAAIDSVSMPAASAVPVPGEASRSSSSLSSEGERRHVSVLFSDLSGYTAMTERLDPETVAEIIGRIKSEAVRIVEHHGGIVNQFVGDEIVALFGVPIAHDDDAVRAVRAALALHRMAKDVTLPPNAGTGQPLRLHSGIDSGLIVTSVQDQRDGTYGITGDVVNTGARLAAQAAADQVLVSPQTSQLVEAYVEVRPLAPIILKGKAEPLTPYEIVGPTGAGSRFEAAQRRGLSRYVGRSEELATLLASIDRTRLGEGQSVAVIGEAGVGKSRLVFELCERIDPAIVRILHGRCQSYGTDAPFLPFLDALRRALDFSEEDSAAALLGKTLTAVQDLDQRLEHLLPHYLHLLSIPSQPYRLPEKLQGAQRRRALEEALAAFFTLAARQRPLLLILEDWHWADPTSNAVLKRLVSLAGQYPLMIVVLSRPEYDFGWAAPTQLTRIVLRALGLADTRVMACAALHVDSLSDELGALMHERTAGNPLFIEEVCVGLLQEKRLTLTAGRAALSGRLEHVRLPTTVQAVIRARVDRLDDLAQEVLEVAAVIGREFSRTLLEHVVTARGAIDVTLDRLSSQDFIRPVRVVPEPEYMFKHVLTQVVVYDTLLVRQRQTLHGIVGRAIEELYADRLEEHYEALAHHYRHSDNLESAIRYLELAGDKAKSQYVLQHTLQNYQQAIDLLAGLEKTPERMRWHIDLALRWADLIVPSAALIHALHVSQDYAEQLGDAERLARATSFLGAMLFYTCDFDGAITACCRVISMADTLADRNRVGSAHRVLGQLYFYTQRHAAGLGHVEEGLRIVRETQYRYEESCCLAVLATEYGLRGQFAQSLALFDEGIRIARESAEHSIEVWNYLWRGTVECAKGDWQDAIATADQAYQRAQQIENLWVVWWATILKEHARVMARPHGASPAAAHHALRDLENSGARTQIALAYGWLAEIAYHVGQPEESIAYAEQAVAQLHLTSHCPGQPYRIRAMGASKRRPVAWASVEADMQKSLAVARNVGYRPELAVSQFRYAELLRDKGDTGGAREHLNEAGELFAEMEMTWWRAQADGLRSELSA
jgi:predicted ATPase/class 3 adenylate cyclase